MNPIIKKILAPVASLRLTIVLLLLSMLIVLAGTTAQREMGIQEVQHQFFHCWLAKIKFHYFQPAPELPTGSVVSVDAHANTITINGVSRLHTHGQGDQADTNAATEGGESQTVYKLTDKTKISVGGAHTLADIKAGQGAFIQLAADNTIRSIEAPQTYIGGFIYLPGGYTLMAVILVNLLAAHTLRFKLRAKRIGIIMIHSGLILLIGGEIATSLLAVESQIRIDVPRAKNDTRGPNEEIKTSTNFAEDIRYAELAIVDHSPADHDNVCVISQSRLKASAGGAEIRDPKLPFDVKVLKYYENSRLVGPHEPGEADRLSNAGSTKDFGIRGIPKVSGVGGEAAATDMPSAFIALSKDGKPLGTYLVSLMWSSEQVQVGDKTYEVGIRLPRYYKPYTMTLKDFKHEIIPGTDTPRDYSSTIQLVSPQNHVDREVRIWMNHPLRFAGDTVYQQSFTPNNKTTILEVVHNPVFMAPYIACAWGGAGLIVHFGITLLSFLRRRLAPKPGTVGAVGMASPRPVLPLAGKRRPSEQASPRSTDRYTLKPEPGWKVVGIPLFCLVCALIYVVTQLFNSAPIAPYNLNSFGRIPIFIEGRTQPLDSVARNFLGIVNGGHTTFLDENGHEHPAIEWLADVMTRSHNWADDKVIVIDFPEVKGYFGLNEDEKRFSWKDLKLDDPNVFRKFEKQAQLARQVPEKQRDDFQSNVLQLERHIGIYWRLLQVNAIAFQQDAMNDPAVNKKAFDGIRKLLEQMHPELFENGEARKTEEAKAKIELAVDSLDRSKLKNDERNALDSIPMLRTLHGNGPEGQLLLIPPVKIGDPDHIRQVSSRKQDLEMALEHPQNDESPAAAKRREAFQAELRDVEKELGPYQWQSLLTVVLAPDETPESATAFLKIARDYAGDLPADFNTDVAGYLARTASLPGTEPKTVSYEAGFNNIAPFYICETLYVCIFILAFGSWLFWAKPLSRTGFWLMVLALIVHTVGLISRIYISGRPPVTNLYSASVFIGWGVVVFSIAIEAIFRNGIGLLAGSVAGFLSLLVAAAFASGDGDTMKQLQAVLDTNIWLATHVVCVTLGYTATVFAGVLATIYILRGVFDRSFNETLVKDNARMVYGVVCFAMLFSFVGTILGGIWADQSWGRFWGWDPKENGAVLVVLWNALILHARWSGMVRERGVAVLAVLGNLVVGWSMVGTNLMGIGLHSYGFMSGAQQWLNIWWGANLVLAGIGLIPKKFWKMNTRSVESV